MYYQMLASGSGQRAASSEPLRSLRTAPTDCFLFVALSLSLSLVKQKKDFTAKSSPQQQMYAYGVPQIAGYTGPDLYIDNLHFGNEARFMNDCSGHPSPRAATNAVAFLYV